jgi:hypothetical protein
MTTTAAEPRISRFGEYSGFTTPAYDGWTRKSQYIETRDGTRLAADVFTGYTLGAVYLRWGMDPPAGPVAAAA